MDKKASKVQLFKDKKKLRCHFPKSKFGVFGQACIKRLPIMDFSTLPKWTSKEDLRYALSTVIYFICSKIKNFVVITDLFKYSRTRLVKRAEVFTHKLFVAQRYSYRDVTGFCIPIQVMTINPNSSIDDNFQARYVGIFRSSSIKIASTPKTPQDVLLF